VNPFIYLLSWRSTWTSYIRGRAPFWEEWYRVQEAFEFGILNGKRWNFVRKIVELRIDKVCSIAGSVGIERQWRWKSLTLRQIGQRKINKIQWMFRILKDWSSEFRMLQGALKKLNGDRQSKSWWIHIWIGSIGDDIEKTRNIDDIAHFGLDIGVKA
jgi:hypothetical protein